MIRLLAPTTSTAGFGDLVSATITRFPQAVGANEVNDDNGRQVAVYFDDDNPPVDADVTAWQAAMAAFVAPPPVSDIPAAVLAAGKVVAAQNDPNTPNPAQGDLVNALAVLAGADPLLGSVIAAATAS